MNGWFPKIRQDGLIASGNIEVWVAGVKVVPVGGFPIWVGNTLGYNNRVGGTVVGTTTYPLEYNELVGSDDGRWAGFVASSGGRVDIYTPGSTLPSQIPGGYAPRFAPGQFAFLHPYNQDFRALFLNGERIADGAIMDVLLGAGEVVWWVATSVHGREIRTRDGVVSIRTDEKPIAVFQSPDEGVWLVTNTSDATFIRPLRSSMGYMITPALYYPDARMIGNRLRVAGSTGQGEPRFDNWIDFTNERVQLPLIIDEEPVPIPDIGPRSEPLPADGTEYDLLSFVRGDGAAWPRSGPTHPMNMVMGSVPGTFLFAKFGGTRTGAYEAWAWDSNWLYQLEDASNAIADYRTDPRFFPRRMKIGEEHAFTSGSERVFYDRGTCGEVRRDPAGHRVWIEAIYPEFYCGPDFGNRMVMVLAYDPTWPVIGPGRNIELGYYALGIGSIRWDSYHSEMLYPEGATKAFFTEAAREHRSDFYLLGGENTQVNLTGCVPLRVPSYPPWEPEPEPEPEPPNPEEPKMLYVDLNRPNLLAFKAEEVDNGNGSISLKKTNGRYACLTPEGQWEERSSPGGPWESFLKGSNALVADRDWNGVEANYLIPYVEIN